MGCKPSKLAHDKHTLIDDSKGTRHATIDDPHYFIISGDSGPALSNQFLIRLFHFHCRHFIETKASTRVVLNWNNGEYTASSTLKVPSRTNNQHELYWPEIAAFDWSTSTKLSDLNCDIIIQQTTRSGMTDVAKRSINLESIANGPSSFDMETTNGFRFTFSLRMAQVALVTLRFNHIDFGPREIEDVSEYTTHLDFLPLASRHTLKFTLSQNPESAVCSDQSEISRTPEWSAEMLPALRLKTTDPALRTESLRISIFEENAIRGEVWLSFSKLADGGTQFKERVWNEGKVVGSLNMDLEISGFPMFKQMPFGVNSGSTVSRVSQIKISSPRASGFSSPALRLREISTLLAPPSAVTISAVSAEIDKILATPFIYDSQVAVSRSEETIINFTETLLLLYPISSWAVKKIISKHLVLILNRAEVDNLCTLPNLPGNFSSFSEARADSTFQVQMTNRLRWRSVQWDLALLALTALQSEKSFAIYELSPDLIPSILVRMYFQVPAFRTGLLDMLLSPAEKNFEIEEWRGCGFALWPASRLDESNENWGTSRSAKLLFDISSTVEGLREFFPDHFLPNWNGVKSRASEMRAISIICDEVKWKERLSKKGTTFLLFVRSWGRYVSEILSNNGPKDSGQVASIPWQHIIGYRSLVKAVLLCMRSLHVEKFPDALVNAMASLVRNPKIASVAVKLTMRRTNIFDQSAVACGLRMVDYFFQTLAIRKWKLPSDFDFSFFHSAITTLLTGDSARNTHNAIWLYFRNFQVLSVDTELFMKTWLSREIFEKLLSHWSPIVRHRFVTLLLYRIWPASKTEEISRSLDKCMRSFGSSLDAFKQPPDLRGPNQVYLTFASADWKEISRDWIIWMALSPGDRESRLPAFSLSDGAELGADPDLMPMKSDDHNSDGDD